MRWLLIALLSIVIIVIVGILNVPAKAVPMVLQELEARGMMPADAPRLKLDNTEGTLWRGQANAATLIVDGVSVDLGVVNWHIDRLSLLSSAPQLQVSANSDHIKASARVIVENQEKVSVQQLEGRLPITTLEPWMPMLVTGEIGFFVDRLEMAGRHLLALNGLVNFEYIDWVGADYNMPLGSYMAEISLVDHRQVSMVINDLQALLGITGTLSVDLAGHYQFDAILKPRDGLAREVRQSIRWFGRVDENGDVEINSQGRF